MVRPDVAADPLMQPFHCLVSPHALPRPHCMLYLYFRGRPAQLNSFDASIGPEYDEQNYLAVNELGRVMNRGWEIGVSVALLGVRGKWTHGMRTTRQTMRAT